MASLCFWIAYVGSKHKQNTHAIIWIYTLSSRNKIKYSRGIYICYMNKKSNHYFTFYCIHYRKTPCHITGYLGPNWSGLKYPEGIHSHDEVRKPCLYVTSSESVFLHYGRSVSECDLYSFQITERDQHFPDWRSETIVIKPISID